MSKTFKLFFKGLIVLLLLSIMSSFASGECFQIKRGKYIEVILGTNFGDVAKITNLC
jgi:hypothetical protein